MKFATLLLLLFSFNTVAQQPSMNDEKKAINAIVKQFEMAIINKDKPGFMALFFDGPISWIGVIADETLVKRRVYMASLPEDQRRPESKNKTGNPEEFIDFIVQSPKALRESFDNIKIITDGSVASVHFDYVFYYGDHKGNWGEEAWHLVKTYDGWRINSVIYSIIINPAQLKKEKKEKKVQ